MRAAKKSSPAIATKGIERYDDSTLCPDPQDGK
jgi:hypothetical protein